jgi:hypothetical protein
MADEEQHAMTDEDRDTQRARELRDATTRASDVVFVRLREAVRAGSIDAMRAAYAGNNGFLIGTGAAHAHSERVVLTGVLENSAVPLELLGVFFNELGGRFIVDGIHNVCVFSLLVQIECTTHITQDVEVERWTLRMAEVVRYLVEKIGFPIRMRIMYAMRPFATPRMLMMLAMNSGAWACYTAFAQFMNPVADFFLLESVLTQHHAGVTSNYWVARFAAGLDDWEGRMLLRLSQRTDFLPEHIALLNVEGERFARIRQHMQALLLLQQTGPGNAAAREVMDIDNLSRMILTQAFEDAPF